jgi:ribonuclease D
MSVKFIDTQDAFHQFCQQIKDSNWLAIDTEFLREKTYHPQLCLIQIANDDVIACVDPLAITDLTELLDILYKPDMTLVFHAARQDLELFFLLRDALPQNLFDTQLAATVLGYGDQIGYGKLVKECLDVDLDKSHSRTDWSKRPLDQAQIDYAADDVRYLRKLYPILKSSLNEKGRLTWLSDDFTKLTDIKTYTPAPDKIWRKVKGAGRLKGVQLAILQKISQWREHKAIEKNRPRRWILKDEVVLDLARIAPKSTDKLKKIRGLEDKTISKHGQTLINEIEKAKSLPESEWPIIKQPIPLTNEQEALIDALMALLRHYCAEQSIAPAAVATRKDIELLVRGEPDISLVTGWRREIVGQYLEQFLRGELNISANHQQLNTK